MPVSSQRGSNTDRDVPDRVRPYLFHGLDLEDRGAQWVGDCPFCASGKFSVHADTSLWRCFVCGSGTDAGGGNSIVFLRMLHAMATGLDDDCAAISADRRLRPDTVVAWGAVRSPMPGGPWLVPGYGTGGSLDQLYRRTWYDDKWHMWPTPGVWPVGRSHALHMAVGDLDPDCDMVYVCEGPWDGMALWEALRDSDHERCQVIAVPGCNVWQDEWTKFCRDKRVVLMFDSDHPRQDGSNTFRSGWDGMARVTRRLAGAAASVSILRWGPDGYDPDRPSGWDVRDHLTLCEDQQAALADLLDKVGEPPEEWFAGGGYSTNGRSGSHSNIESRDCDTWAECEDAWKESMHWRQDMGDVLSVILAVCASTNQAGNQIFLDIVGSPGVAKTTILRGALTSPHCIHVENISKILSGYKKKDDGDGDKDCSFLARANNKTWITCEFDTILTSSQYVDLMGKMRRIFDGETSSTYGNRDVDRIYTGLRTPWIRAGTWRMMDTDQSQLGDRFLRVIINDPDHNEMRAILRSAMRSERVAMLESSNGTNGSLVDAKTRKAYALTGGYVDWLRAFTEDQLTTVDMSDDAEDACLDMAVLSADMRARPNEDKRKKENTDCKEIPTRLARQYMRLSQHLAVVLNKREVDTEVLRIVRKVALDTAHGHSLNIARWLCSPNPQARNRVSYQEAGGLMDKTLQTWTGLSPERLEVYMAFLKKIDVVEWRSSRSSGAWVLTDRALDLYLRVVRA